MFRGLIARTDQAVSVRIFLVPPSPHSKTLLVDQDPYRFVFSVSYLHTLSAVFKECEEGEAPEVSRCAGQADC